LSRLRLVWLSVTALLACSRVPAFAQPEGGLMDPSALKGGDFIDYRKLTRADFRGKAPSGAAAEHADAIGAQTHAILRADSNLDVWIDGAAQPSGRVVYSGKLAHRLHFRAEMDRRRSWWNPRLDGIPPAYVLEHEQIHFAIAAAEAHKLNQEAPELTERMHAAADSQEGVRDAIQKQLNDVIRGAFDEVMAENRDFDEDTSGRFEPKKQAEWLRKVTAELSEK